MSETNRNDLVMWLAGATVVAIVVLSIAGLSYAGITSSAAYYQACADAGGVMTQGGVCAWSRNSEPSP